MSAYEKLDEIAKGVQRDVAAQAKADGHDWDTSYDIWVEELRNTHTGDRQTVGVIDMGDLYQGVYTYDGREWHDAYGQWEDPYHVVARIIAKREYERGL